ncbi:MAG: hypothetical protein RLZZ436_3547 [Planctomycetota bacterium]
MKLLTSHFRRSPLVQGCRHCVARGLYPRASARRLIAFSHFSLLTSHFRRSPLVQRRQHRVARSLYPRASARRLSAFSHFSRPTPGQPARPGSRCGPGSAPGWCTGVTWSWMERLRVSLPLTSFGPIWPQKKPIGVRPMSIGRYGPGSLLMRSWLHERVPLPGIDIPRTPDHGGAEFEGRNQMLLPPFRHSSLALPR